jgi:hypothetical protein
MLQAEQNEMNSKLTMPSARPAEILLLATQLAKLMAWARAMSLKQPLTETQADVHMQEWALIADEVGFDALAEAVKDVMRNDSDWFPSVRAIRQRAGLNQQEQVAVDANEAWNEVQRYLRLWGGEGHPFWRNGQREYPPPLTPRLDYAMRRVGGLRAIDRVTAAALPFMRKDFDEAYRLAPLAEQRRLQLSIGSNRKNLSGAFRDLLPTKKMEGAEG